MKNVSQLPDAYPLQWPAGWSRTATKDRKSSRYRTSNGKVRKDLLESIRLLGGVLPIISSNMQVRLDGLPYANSTSVIDPGVAVYWVREGQQEVMACDRWETPWENLRAIFHAIEALRAMERAGATQILNRAFEAFQLPSGGPSVGKRHWREVLDYGNDPLDAGLIRARFKSLAVKLHPDVGGDIERFKELEAAYREAMKEVE